MFSYSQIVEIEFKLKLSQKETEYRVVAVN